MLNPKAVRRARRLSCWCAGTIKGFLQ